MTTQVNIGELEILERIKTHVDSGVSGELDIELLVEELDQKFSADEIIAVVEKVAVEFNIVKSTVVVCPEHDCQHVLDTAAIDNNHCDHCGTDFLETGDEPLQKSVYKVVGERSRDINWMIVVHGFNTDGKWQEEFSWQIANELKYSAPIFIYKYGIVRLGVLFPFRHRRIAKELGLRIKRAIKFAQENGTQAKPDIIVHSFGSKLFATMLEMSEFDQIEFGRVITTGSIIVPDYDWQTVISNGRIEELLNHRGGKDRAVPLAQFFIPGTGPSGKVGFLDQAVSNYLSNSYGHSSFFIRDNLSKNISEGGLWDKFLTWPIVSFRTSLPNESIKANWKAWPKFVRVACNFAAIGSIGLLLGATLIWLIYGLSRLVFQIV